MTGKAPLVGRWRESNGAITEYTADGHVISGPYNFRYRVIAESHLELILDGVPNAEKIPMTVSYTINGRQMAISFTEVKGIATLPPELRGIHHSTYVGP